MLTPQDSQKQLLFLAAERIESATFSPPEGSAAANAIQHFLTDVRIVDHGQAVEITAGGLGCHVRLTGQEGDVPAERQPVQNHLAFPRAPTADAEGGGMLADDFDAED